MECPFKHSFKEPVGATCIGRSHHYPCLDCEEPRSSEGCSPLWLWSCIALCTVLGNLQPLFKICKTDKNGTLILVEILSEQLQNVKDQQPWQNIISVLWNTFLCPRSVSQYGAKLPLSKAQDYPNKYSIQVIFLIVWYNTHKQNLWEKPGLLYYDLQHVI